MPTSISIKRKNIDLPIDTIQKLSLLAVAKGLSLKAYIERLLISKANSLTIEIKENPSPSNDPWFDDSNNLAIVAEGMEQYRQGKVKPLSTDEIKDLLGI